MRLSFAIIATVLLTSVAAAPSGPGHTKSNSKSGPAVVRTIATTLAEAKNLYCGQNTTAGDARDDNISRYMASHGYMMRETTVNIADLCNTEEKDWESDGAGSGRGSPSGSPRRRSPRGHTRGHTRVRKAGHS
ncbi:hypothetical protein C8J56DRAFT_1058838 [Mycena floridula]|nr:hypothetical protein C8J56DRAFT_1058838 [Mycena floridula]